MADFIENEEAGKVDSFPFYLAKVAAVSNGKYSLIFYGQSEPTSKYYRRIYIPNTSPGVGKTGRRKDGF